jgi:hypothetical protein
MLDERGKETSSVKEFGIFIGWERKEIGWNSYLDLVLCIGRIEMTLVAI